MSESTITVEVARGVGGTARTEAFEVPREESQTVLDVVAWIQQNTDPTLTYRYACRVGVCGSCAMTVNGEPRWTCRTHVGKVVRGGRMTVGPLRNLPVIKDLVVDLDPFFDKWVAAEGVFHPTRSREDAIEPIRPDSAEREAADAGIECINCAVCYSACDVVGANPDYLGPAALNRAWTLYNDARDDARGAILDAVSGTGGCHNCHSMGSCARYCPAELNPTNAIAGLKRATMARSLFGRR
ncbi:succinate dehydrogenase/fumarate reductase iron-sulfur subunit [Acuticoccus sp.]|uniref:succinate dehydrogenase/fumarate reductase iron-sulfur subunit n=1 Tax=Acuticoccus sp. TaxID=1904378 RepID=UPI003B521FF2